MDIAACRQRYLELAKLPSDAALAWVAEEVGSRTFSVIFYQQVQGIAMGPYYRFVKNGVIQRGILYPGGVWETIERTKE